MSGFADDIRKFKAYLEKQEKELESKKRKFVTVACAEVERQAKTLMRDTVVDIEKSYGKKGHHPSLPGNAPAPDTGTLMRSITHEVRMEGREPTGVVGSTLVNPDYPKYLEYGTSKMKPRPWLSAAIVKSQSFIAQAWQAIMKGDK